MDNIANRIVAERNKKGLNQEDMADELGISKSAYQNYEAGKRDVPLGVFKDMCKIFNVASSYLLYGIKEEDTPEKNEKKLLELYRNATQQGKHIALGALLSNQQESDSSKKGA